MIRPDEQLRAGHIPAALLPHGTDPRTVVIVQAAPPKRRSIHAGAVGVVLAATAGFGALIWLGSLAVLEMAGVAATTAAAIQDAMPALLGTLGGGSLLTITIRIRRRRKGK